VILTGDKIKQETLLSLTNRATHLCSRLCNGVFDTLTRLHREEPKKNFGSDGATPLGTWARLNPMF